MSKPIYGIDPECEDAAQRELMDFNNPAHARKFLRDYRLPNGQPLTVIEVARRGFVDAHSLNDLEVCHYAWGIFVTDLQNGNGWMEETEVH